MKPITFIAALAIASFQNGCTSFPLNKQIPGLAEPAQYESLVAQETKSDKQYDGFINTLDIKVTNLTSGLLDLQGDMQAHLFLWSENQYQDNKKKKQESEQKETRFFMSFFVPEKRHDDLAKNSTRWQMILESGADRWQGKATKNKVIYAELQRLYPHHTRWHSAYEITFPIARKALEGRPLRLTITSPVGQVQFPFAP